MLKGLLHPISLSVRSALRQGELFALQWGDHDYYGRFIEVQRNFCRGRITTPKSGEGRGVHMSQELTQAFRDLRMEREVDTAVNGWQSSRLGSFVTRVAVSGR
jgi:integrase